MGLKVDDRAQLGAASDGKAPRTARGERTLRKILDAAREEFGERGFSDSSIVGITQRAGVALGTFYTYFDSKEALFQALVRDMSAQVRDMSARRFGEGNRCASTANGARSKPSFGSRATIATSTGSSTKPSSSSLPPIASIMKRPRPALPRASHAARDKGEISADFSDEDLDILAWGMMGANVFLGLRFAVWDSADPKKVAEAMSRVWRTGLVE